jgi:hypothetical protein
MTTIGPLWSNPRTCEPARKHHLSDKYCHSTVQHIVQDTSFRYVYQYTEPSTWLHLTTSNASLIAQRMWRRIRGGWKRRVQEQCRGGLYVWRCVERCTIQQCEACKARYGEQPEDTASLYHKRVGRNCTSLRNHVAETKTVTSANPQSRYAMTQIMF